MDSLPQIRWVDLIDILLVATFFWAALVWLRRTPARLALVGFAILAGVYVVAQRLGLQLTAWILQGFFAVSVLVVVVVFQEDLRRLFEQIAVWGLRRRVRVAPAAAMDTLIRVVARLAGERVGALLVLPGREPVERHVDGGIVLDARLSEPLLLSLFDPHSPGHDGAVILSGERVVRFAVHLPLSHDHGQLQAYGTRHAAALGLAERTDALCVVVSEERGTVSVARQGRLCPLAQPQLLSRELREFLDGVAPSARRARSLGQRLGERWLQALLAVGLAAGLWLVFVPGSTVTAITRQASVVVENLPEGFVLDAVEPPDVVVTLSGRRRDVYLVRPDDLRVDVDALLVQLGRRTFHLSPAQVRHPPRVTVRAVTPSRVRLSVRRRQAKGGDAPTSGAEVD